MSAYLPTSHWPAWLIALGLMACSSASVSAAAFLQPPGEGIVILATSFERSDRYIDASGKFRPVGAYRKFELKTYLEYGISNSVTVILAPSWSAARGSVLGAPAKDGIGQIEAGTRVQLWQGGAGLVSFQATIRAPFATQEAPGVPLRREVFETDLRLMYGAHFSLGGLPAFASLEAAYRLRAGGGDERRFDATLGVHLSSRWMALLQGFNVWTTRETLFPSRRMHKGQASIVYRFAERWSLQMGAYFVPAGRNVRQEQGAIAGLWRKF